MYKLLFLLTSVFAVSVFAVPDNAVDFISKDTKGLEHHLFAHLDAGKYVLLEFIAEG